MNKLKFIKKKHSGRDVSGQIVVRHQGGQQKRYLRTIDFKRDKIGILGKVVSIEYDPNRTSDIALIQYTDGEKRYILHPAGLNLEDTVLASKDADIKVGNALPLEAMPVGTFVHNIELVPGKGGQMARSAGASVAVVAKEGGFAHPNLIIILGKAACTEMTVLGSIFIRKMIINPITIITITMTL